MPEMYPPNETPRRPAGPLNPPTEPVRPGLLSPGELETGSGPLVGASPLHEARWPKVNQFSPGGTMQTVLLTSNPPGGHQPSSTGSPPPEMTPPSPTALPLEGLPVSPELVEIAGLAGAIGRTREIRTHYVVLQRKVTLIESLIPRRCEHWQIEVELPQVPAVGCWIEVPWVRRDAATKPYRFYIDGQNNRIILSSGEYDARVELSTEMGLRTWDSQKWGEQHKQSGWRLTRVDLSSSPPYESRRADYATAEAAMRDGWYVVPYNGQLWQWRHPVVPMTVVYDPQHLSHSPYDLPLGLHVQCVPKTVVDLPVMTEGVDFTAADVASANPMRPLTAPAQAHDRIRPVFTAPAGQVLVEVKRPQILDAAPQPADLTEDERTRQAAAMNAATKSSWLIMMPPSNVDSSNISGSLGMPTSIL